MEKQIPRNLESGFGSEENTASYGRPLPDQWRSGVEVEKWAVNDNEVKQGLTRVGDG